MSEYKTTSIRLEGTLMKKLKLEAKSTRRSFSGMLEYILMERYEFHLSGNTKAGEVTA